MELWRSCTGSHQPACTVAPAADCRPEDSSMPGAAVLIWPILLWHPLCNPQAGEQCQAPSCQSAKRPTPAQFEHILWVLCMRWPADGVSGWLGTLV